MSSSKEGGQPVSVLFVCLGNICRSTMAEGVFRHVTQFGSEQQHALINEIDSCGTGAYHTGDRPDSRTMAVLAQNGITTYKHQARKVKVPEDFQRFDYILAMDENNYSDLRDMVKRAKAKGTLTGDEINKVHMFGEYGGRDRKEEIDDPYYGGRNGFETAYAQVVRFSKGLIKDIEDKAEGKL